MDYKQLISDLRNTPMTFVPNEIPKQETLEEAAEKESEVQGWGKYESNSEQYAIKQSFIRGAKYQAEIMYSEEELKSAYAEGGFAIMRYLDGKECLDVDKWFKQFKKK